MPPRTSTEQKILCGTSAPEHRATAHIDGGREMAASAGALRERGREDGEHGGRNRTATGTRVRPVLDRQARLAGGGVESGERSVERKVGWLAESSMYSTKYTSAGGYIGHVSPVDSRLSVVESRQPTVDRPTAPGDVWHSSQSRLPRTPPSASSSAATPQQQQQQQQQQHQHHHRRRLRYVRCASPVSS